MFWKILKYQIPLKSLKGIVKFGRGDGQTCRYDDDFRPFSQFWKNAQKSARNIF
jgi:hypothetical protein